MQQQRINPSISTRKLICQFNQVVTSNFQNQSNYPWNKTLRMYCGFWNQMEKNMSQPQWRKIMRRGDSILHWRMKKLYDDEDFLEEMLEDVNLFENDDLLGEDLMEEDHRIETTVHYPICLQLRINRFSKATLSHPM